MAFIDFSLTPVDSTPHEALASTPPATQQLTALEWSVVALARRDRPASLREPSRMARALGGLFGRGANSQLAHPRLEALRRLAVHAWHYGYQLPVSEMKAFLASGFSTDQLDTILTSIAAARTPRRRIAA